MAKKPTLNDWRAVIDAYDYTAAAKVFRANGWSYVGGFIPDAKELRRTAEYLANRLQDKSDQFLSSGRFLVTIENDVPVLVSQALEPTRFKEIEGRFGHG